MIQITSEGFSVNNATAVQSVPHVVSEYQQCLFFQSQICQQQFVILSGIILNRASQTFVPEEPVSHTVDVACGSPNGIISLLQRHNCEMIDIHNPGEGPSA